MSHKVFFKVKIIVLVSFHLILSAIKSMPCQAQEKKTFKAGLFDNDDILKITLSGSIRELIRDKSDDAKYHPITLTYPSYDGNVISIPIEVKTRGHFRRTQGGCSYPPLLLNFSKDDIAKESLFYQQKKMKLVTPCRDEKYVVREYLIYKLANLVTPKSFRARLVKVVYADTRRGKNSDSLFGILLEEEEQMAKRNNMVTLETKLLRPERTEPTDFLKMAVFEYMIANTDWSVQYLQNVKLIAADTLSTPSTVPYDFDHAGLVDAPYAKPAEALQLRSVRERRYRGYCISDMSKFEDTFAFFRQLKDKIYAVYSDCRFIEEGYVRSTTLFLDEFYKTINDPVAAQKDFTYPCDKDGTGNVVIMGLDKN